MHDSFTYLKMFISISKLYLANKQSLQEKELIPGVDESMEK